MRSEQEEDKEEAFWKMDGALYTTAGWRKREKKRNLSRRNPPRTGLSRMAPRAEKRETHISRNVLCDCTVLYPSHRSPSLFSLSLTPTKTSRSRIKNLIIIKTNSEENDATRNEKHHRISPKTKDIINHRVIIRTCTVVCFLSAYFSCVCVLCANFIRKENVVFLWFGRFCFLHRPRVGTKKQQKRGKEPQKAWEEDTCHRTCAPQMRQNHL